MEHSLATMSPTTASWEDVFVMLAAFLLVGVGALIWVLLFRKRKRKRRHRHRHGHERRATNPTLAEKGGLPPARSQGPPDVTTSQGP